MSWSEPITEGRLTSPYGPRTAPTTGASTWHHGVDIAPPKPGQRGVPVRAMGDGRVVAVGRHVSRGIWVLVHHDDGTHARPQHLAYTMVVAGQHVSAGAVLGAAGDTGTASGIHTHIEVWDDGVTPTGPSVTSRRTTDPELWATARGIDLHTGTHVTTVATPATPLPAAPAAPIPSVASAAVALRVWEDDDMLTLILWGYTDLVGRGPSTDEICDRIRDFDGATPLQVLKWFLASRPEPTSVTLAFNTYLGHPPNPAQMAEQLAKPTIAQVRADIAGSQEAIARRGR